MKTSTFSRAAIAFICAIVAASLLARLAPALAAGPTFPALTGRVVDDADILSSGVRAELDSMLAQEEQQTGNQVVVVTLKSLQGYTIEDYGYQLGRHWGIGQKKKDNGVLIIVAPNEHKARIEVGYGLEGQLTDAQSKLIIAEIMTPAFRRGDFDQGVLQGTDAVLKTLGGATINPNAQSPDDQDDQGAPIPLSAIVIIFVLFAVFGRFLWPLLFFGGPWGGGPWGGRGGGFGGGGFGGGGFGGGGFGGGGGSFGGGGASGSW